MALLCSVVINSTWSQGVPAFPGAEGFGSDTKGGRFGRVIFVTNTSDSGPGSLREAVKTEEPRTIIFRVSGIIDLLSPLIINSPYVTIAGQSSPGKGICIRGNSLVINSHDIVLRYLRIRPGDIEYGSSKNWDALDGITIMNPALDKSVYNIVIDHCSISWAVDENVGIWHDSHSITIQNSIISEALNSKKHPKGPNHSMGMLIGHTSTDLSIHHNLFLSNNDRNPLIISRDILIDVKHNIIYNAGSTASAIITENSLRQDVNYVGNVIIQGPNTTATMDLSIKGSGSSLSLHAERNYFSTSISSKLCPARISSQKNFLASSNTQQLTVRIEESSTPTFDEPSLKMSLEESLQGLGASLPMVDEIDQKAFEDLFTHKGKLVSSRSSDFNWPRYDLQSFLEPDLDSDGMYDSWEKFHGLSTSVVDNLADNDGDSYTNVEEFLNGTDPNKPGGEVDMSYLKNVIPRNFGLPDVNIFPNPTTSKANINIDIAFAGQVELYLIDVSGSRREIMKEYAYPGNYQLSIDLGDIQDPFIFSCVAQGEIRSCQKVLVKH